MTFSQAVSKEFIDSASNWLCDGYASDIRYIGSPYPTNIEIVCASIGLSPIKASIDHSMSVRSANIASGQICRHPVTRLAALSLLESAIAGTIPIEDESRALTMGSTLDSFVPSDSGDLWFSPLKLTLRAPVGTGYNSAQALRVDNELRAGELPFDGIQDLARWLGFGSHAISGAAPTIEICVFPPVDLIVEQTQLSNGALSVSLIAVEQFDVQRVGVAVNAVPASGLTGRRQVSASIRWGAAVDGMRRGSVSIALEMADQALVMLTIGATTIRRHWFVDPARARNSRLAVLQHFDVELEKTKKAVLTLRDGKGFEQGVASLLHLHGFSAVIPVETDAPDLIVTTPAGQFAIIECTIRMADVAAKIGKLVDRRNSLVKALAGSNEHAKVVAVLICRLPRDQIAVTDEELDGHRIKLLSKEDLDDAISRVRSTENADEVFDRVWAQLNRIER